MNEVILPLKGRENVAAIVPHRNDMLFLDGIEAFGDGSLKASAVIADSPFLRQGRAPSYIAFELIAQSISAYSYLRGLRNGDEPLIGFILRVSDFTISRPFLADGSEVDISIHEDCALGDDLYSFTGSVSSDGEEIASGRLLVMCSQNGGI